MIFLLFCSRYFTIDSISVSDSARPFRSLNLKISFGEINSSFLGLAQPSCLGPINYSSSSKLLKQSFTILSKKYWFLISSGFCSEPKTLSSFLHSLKLLFLHISVAFDDQGLIVPILGPIKHLYELSSFNSKTRSHRVISSIFCIIFFFVGLGQSRNNS